MTEKKKRNSVKKILNKAFVLCTIVCLCFSQTAIFAKADVVEFTEAAKLGATMVDLYGMVNNSNLAYQNMTESGALAQVIQLYDNYYSSASDPVTLATIGAALAVAGTVAVIYDAVTGQGYVQFYQEQYIESMDGYWDYACNDMGLTRNTDGYYEYNTENGVVQQLYLYQNEVTCIDDLVLQTLPIDTTINEVRFRVENRNDNVPSVYYYWIELSNGNYVMEFIQNNPSFNIRFQNGNYGWVNRAGTGQSYENFYFTNFDSSAIIKRYRPECGSIVRIGTTDLDDGEPDVLFPQCNLAISSQAIVCDPTYYTDLGEPISNVITFPDPTAPEYHPVPVKITTNIPWNPEWGNPLPDGVTEPEYGVSYPVTDPETLNNAVPDIWSEVVADNVAETEIAEPEPAPEIGTTTIPLLPITLPSFNFSFSSIWHYVVDWVASLGAWFTTMFTMWNALPYAMVIPVYATAVVVIVIGVYKRFFM